MIARASLILFVAGLMAGCQSPAPRQSPDQTSPPVQQAPTPASADERARAHTELAASYLQIGRYAVALQEVDEALKADSKYVPAHHIHGLIYMQLGEDAKAEKAFKRALRLSPDDSEANNSYGLFLCDRKREKEALPYFMTAVKNPLYATPQDSFVNAGICARRAGDDVAAQQYFERALAVRPNEPRALANLVQMHFDHKQFYLAKEKLDTFMQQAKNPDPGILWLGARIENVLGDRAAVMSYGTQLTDKYPASREARLYSEGRFE